ncbi:MAG: hypothetical protein E7371_06295 [Clostridiales bacterium]|nr:hypothetical protein [Clostridiales bacterium]
MELLNARFQRQINIGAAYYPEVLRDDALIADDISKMKQLGISVVRMGEFAWSTMEEKEGKVDFSFFRHVMDKMYEAEIAVIFCTPSPTPPKWLINKYPEILATKENGETKQFGARNDYCKSSPIYREKVKGISRKIAEALSDHPALVGWQVNNEISPREVCFCSYCKKGFSQYLKDKYKTIDALHAEWGANRWSLNYADFDDILPPRSDVWNHPSLNLEWERFHSKVNTDFINEEMKCIKAYSALPVGTDMMPIMEQDYYETNANADVVMFNHYEQNGFFAHPSLWYDYLRPIKNKPFWVTETQVNWNGAHYPEFGFRPENNCYINTWLPIAKGGELNMYWHWREHFAGQELYHGAVLSSSGRFAYNAFEIKKASDDFRKCKDILLNTRVQSDIAMHFSATAWRTFKYVQPLKNLNYLEFFYDRYHKAMRHYNVDLIDTPHDVSGYKTVISPFLSCVDEHGLKERMMEFVEKGGTWIVGPMSDILKDNAVKYTNAPYSFLEDFAGIYTQIQIPMETEEIKAVWKDGTPLPIGKTFDGYTLNGAESLAEYTSSYLKGLSVIAQKQVGKGKVIVVGSVISGEDMLRLVGVQPIFHASNNVELTKRGDCVIAIEIENQEGMIELPDVYRDVLTDKTYSGKITIGAFSVMVLQKE